MDPFEVLLFFKKSKIEQLALKDDFEVVADDPV